MKHFLALLWVFLGVSGTTAGKLWAHAEKIYYLKGQVGKRELVVRMLCYDETPTRYITYFFGDDKQDRSLAGTFADPYWTFLPKEEKGSETPSQIRLRITESIPDSCWKGSWTDTAGKSQDLVLTHLPADSLAAAFADLPFLKETDPYDCYKLAHLQFTLLRSEQKTKELACDWYREAASGITSFRLRRLDKKGQTATINEALRALHLSLAQAWFSHLPGLRPAGVEVRLPYLTGELASIRVVAKSRTAAGDTVAAKQQVTLALESGKQVDLEQLLCFEQGAAKPRIEDMFQVYKYRKAVFGPKLFSLLSELYPGRLTGDSCGTGKAETWALPAWSLTTAGIAFGTPQGDPCNALQWAVIPYEKLRPYLEKTYHLAPVR
ncbi:hypothetical protein V9K67_21235 [Paraflavisolibacter sp. H34]|uniref:hypothetical protein n=1 Tax=Huijunlia imazamoxiresistens TaxID=3127457 RepID=UPI0030159FF7